MHSRLVRFAFLPLLAIVTAVGCSDPSVLSPDRCGRTNPPTDPAHPPPGLELHVVIGAGLAPPRPGSGFCARAERADGTAFEAMTDASGAVTLPIDPAAGPWDVTVARPTFTAVSILGVTGPVPGVIYTQLTQPTYASSAAPHLLMVTSPGTRAAGFAGLAVFDGDMPLQPVSLEDGTLAFEEYFSTDGPAFALTGVDATRGVFTLDPIARVDRDLDVVMDGTPAPLPPIVTTEIRVHFPWAIAGAGRVGNNPALVRHCDGHETCPWPPYPPTPIDDFSPSGSDMIFHSLSYGPPFAPEAIAQPLGAQSTGGRSIGATVVVRDIGSAVDIALHEAGPATVSGTSPETVRWSSDNPDFDHAILVLLTGEAHVDRPDPPPGRYPAWRVWTYDTATFTARALPTLPAAMRFAELGGTGDFLGANADVVFRASTPSPWATWDPAGFASLAQSPTVAF